MVSVWRATAEIPSYAALSADEEADVVVIGGGWIGLTTALLLAQDGADVVLLEGGRLGSRTSGNTTGKVTSQHGAIYADLIDRHGEDKARLYAEANQAAVGRVAELADSLEIDCELTRTPAFVYTTDSAEKLKREADAATSLGLPAHLTDGREVGVPASAAVRFDDQVQLHPVKYLGGLAAALTRLGGRIYEQTRVVDLDDSVVAGTESGPQVRARHAVVATLLPFGLTGGYFARTRPQESHGIAVRLPTEAPTGMAISIDSPVRSTRPWPGGGPNGLIVVGGGHETGTVEDTEAIYQGLADWVSSTWDHAIQAEHRWSAHDYSTPDLVPYVGKSPGHSSILIATGMHKWGLSNGMVAAGILSDLIADRPNRWHSLYDARRIGDAHAVAKLLKDNLKVGKDFATGHLSRALHTDKPVCTHAGCALTWNNADTTWDCSCHGSRFAADGAVLDGPATEPLDLS
jgi:glycine/D-amino acid oxidase-like deaminating enzyme